MYPRYFTAPGTWLGSYYELNLVYDVASDADLAAAFTRLWSHPDLDGVYLDNKREPGDQVRVDPPSGFGVQTGHVYGLARLPGGQHIACRSACWRWEGYPAFIDLSIPTSAIESAYRMSGRDRELWDSGWQAWLVEIEGWLAGIVRYVYTAAPFRVGIIGEEITQDLHELALQGVWHNPSYFAYLQPHDGDVQYITHHAHSRR